MKNSNLSTLHFEHLNWENELSFYKGQIKLYTDRVEELTKKNTKEGTVVYKLGGLEEGVVAENAPYDPEKMH